MKKHIMAIDAGTGSIRTVIFDESLNQVSVAQREWTHPEDHRYPGAIDFDTEGNFKLMIETIKEAMITGNIAPDSVMCISTTSMREGFVLYDRHGKEIWAVSNVDSRAINEVTTLKAQNPELEEKLFHLSGQTFALGAIPRLLWVKNNCLDLYERIHRITMLNDWLSYKLTGLFSVEPSNGSTTGLIDLTTRDWAPEIIDSCGLKSDIYPPVHESGTLLGQLTEDIAERTGLPKSCRVFVGGGDVQMGCIGVGSIKPGQAALLGGSFWQLEYNTETPSIDSSGRIRTNCHAVEGQYQQELIAFFPGLIMRWFRDGFCQHDIQTAKASGMNPYDLLNAEAEKVPPGCHGMLASFSSIMDYMSWKHPSPTFTNFNLDPNKFNKATFYRSLLENAAYVTLGHKRIIEDTIGTFPEEIVFASGASNSALWCQIVADVLQVKVKVPVVKEATAFGAALHAAVGIGIVPDLNTAVESYVKIEKTYEPDPSKKSIYEAMFMKFCKVSEGQMQLSDTSTLEHMWKAPGL